MRTEFSKATKREALAQSRGVCRKCRLPLQPPRIEYDHILSAFLGGDNSLENCQVLCTPCHRGKTSKVDVPVAAKVKRLQDRRNGIRKPKTFRGWRNFKGEAVKA